MLTRGGLCPSPPPHIPQERSANGPTSKAEASPSLGALAAAKSTRASPDRPLGHEDRTAQTSLGE